jgi:hypothetical protein
MIISHTSFAPSEKGSLYSSPLQRDISEHISGIGKNIGTIANKLKAILLRHATMLLQWNSDDESGMVWVDADAALPADF